MLLDDFISLLKKQDEGQFGCYLEREHIYLKRNCLSQEQESISFRETIHYFFSLRKKMCQFFLVFII